MAADKGNQTEPRTSTSRIGESRAMEGDEIEEFLERGWWGDLGTVDETGPYVVPIIYGYDGSHFYVASRGGLKIDNIKVNPAICLTVVDAVKGGKWSSVIVRGEAKLVTGPRELTAAIRALRKQVGQVGKITPGDIARMGAARVIQISPVEITGRTRVT